MIRIHEILEKLQGHLAESDLALIKKAYIYSASAHAGQVRLSGEPYLSHPLEVANILADLCKDSHIIAAGLLHDTVEDTNTELADIRENFGEDVAEIVDGVTKVGKVEFSSREEAQAENMRKMFLAMGKDLRVILVKLADRLHNMRTLEFQHPYKQKMIAQETLDIYSPLANRMGIYKIKVELDDLSLKYLKPDIYKQIVSGLQGRKALEKDYIDQVIAIIENILKQNNLKGRVSGRRKHIYSIYNKMIRQNLTLEQVYDLIAFRVIVPNESDCYTVVGLIHSTWKPLPGRFKDYINVPKANMYQSLHTTVIGPGGEHIEIQIRTEDMHNVAELGVAAHWKYKDGQAVKIKDEEKYKWIRQSMELLKDLDAQEFLTNLKIDLFPDEVAVFTPKGEGKLLPRGATPIDFAYHIHTEVGKHCAGAKVNGRLVPLSTELQQGDTVEILTNENQHPSRDWLKYVKTAKARTRIKHWIRTEERARSIALAKELLEKEGRRMNINFSKELKQGSLEAVAEEFSYKSVEELLSAVGYARLTPRQVLGRLLQKDGKEKRQSGSKEKASREQNRHIQEQSQQLVQEGVVIKGVEDVLIRFAKCCQPVPGDPIVGYISRGRGVIVHAADCHNVGQFNPARIVHVSWAGERTERFPACIKLLCNNVTGVLAEVTSLLASKDVNIESGKFYTDLENKTVLFFNIEVNDAEHLYHVIDELTKLDNVLEAIRTSGKQAL